jgi:hypothetical protein
MGFHTTVHEQSIYCGFINGHRILVKRQVDDIAVAAPTSEIASEVINMIGQHVTIQGNHILTKFNGVEVDQTSTYIKLHCHSYIDKVLLNHGWDTPSTIDNSIREPLSASLLKSIDVDTGPPEHSVEAMKIQSSAGFKYRQLLGELMYAHFPIC